MPSTQTATMPPSIAPRIAIATPAYAAAAPNAALAPFTINRREVGPRDVLIDILFCGICHSDIHQVRSEWGPGHFPMVPGHEIVGRVNHIGSEVTRWKPGDIVGVGCFVDSCRECAPCRSGEQQFCRNVVFTYNGLERDGATPTFGGYSSRITVNENYVYRIPPNLDPAGAAPLLCAGITTYAPLRRFNVGPGMNVAVVGLGGLGHMGVKLAHALGAHVTVLSHSPSKRFDALRLGADDFLSTAEPDFFTRNAERFHFILDTVSFAHDYNAYLNLLDLDGAMVLVGAPDPAPVASQSLIMRRRTLAGSLIGGLALTQEMLAFCATHSITSDIEVIPIQQVNEAYDRTVKSDVRYRFVIDMSSLKS